MRELQIRFSACINGHTTVVETNHQSKILRKQNQLLQYLPRIKLFCRILKVGVGSSMLKKEKYFEKGTKS